MATVSNKWIENLPRSCRSCFYNDISTVPWIKVMKNIVYSVNIQNCTQPMPFPEWRNVVKLLRCHVLSITLHRQWRCNHISHITKHIANKHCKSTRMLRNTTAIGGSLPEAGLCCLSTKTTQCWIYFSVYLTYPMKRQKMHCAPRVQMTPNSEICPDATQIFLNKIILIS